MTPRPSRFARLCLVLLWWGTVVASLHDGGAAGIALLQKATSMSAGAALALVLLGCAWDAGIGLLLMLRPGAFTYRLAMLGVIGMTVLASLLQPTLWLDPFGALLKNLPVLALLSLLAAENRPA